MTKSNLRDFPYALLCRQCMSSILRTCQWSRPLSKIRMATRSVTSEPTGVAPTSHVVGTMPSLLRSKRPPAAELTWHPLWLTLDGLLKCFAVCLQDPSLNKSYLFVNEGDVYPGPGNQTHSYVTVIDTSTATVSTCRPYHCIVAPAQAAIG